MSLLDEATDTVEVFLLGTPDPVEVKCRVQPTSAAASSTADGQAAVLQYRAISRTWPAGVTERVVWDGRDWDVDGEPLRHHGSDTTRHVTVLMRPQDIDDVTVQSPGTATDPYGNVLPDWTAPTETTVKAQVVPVKSDEDDPGTGRRRVTDEFDVWLPAGTQVSAGDGLVWRSLTLQVEGDPSVEPGVHRPRPVHVRARLVRG